MHRLVPQLRQIQNREPPLRESYLPAAAHLIDLRAAVVRPSMIHRIVHRPQLFFRNPLSADITTYSTHRQSLPPRSTHVLLQKILLILPEVLALMIHGLHQLHVLLLQQRPVILEIIASLPAPGERMRQNLHFIITHDILLVRISITPDMVCIRHIFDLQFRIIRYSICKCKEIILIGIQDPFHLDVLPQDILRRPVNGEFRDLKSEHFT